MVAEGLNLVILEEGEKREITTDMEVSHVFHPMTYLNKMVLSDGKRLQLWNIKSEKMIYEFRSILPTSNIVEIKQSPVVDVIALGLENGEIWLVNLKGDEVLLKLSQERAPVSISFSSCSDLEKSLLASTNGGEIIFWDLNSAKI